MSYQREREQFFARMSAEGLPYHIIRQLLREATGMNRRAELACSSEAADRDRVACPHTVKASNPCLCYGEGHDASRDAVTRISVQDWQAEQRLRKALPDGWSIQMQGDPRGYTLRVIPPSYAERNRGRDVDNLDAIGVPSGPSGIRW
jgi:hypothetical protein